MCIYTSVSGQSTYDQRKSNPKHLSNSELNQEDPTLPQTFNYFDSVRDFTSKFNFVVNASFKHFQLKEFFDENPTFNKGAYFRSTKFHSTIYFENPLFNSIADFQEAYFNSFAGFSFGKFEDTAIFTKAIFHGPALFAMNFKTVGDFIESRFDSIANFKKSKFNGIANFERCRFDTLSDFENVEFNYIANFLNVKFKSLANFSKAKFNILADFQSALFYNTANFSGVILPDTLNFQNVTLVNSEIDFTSSVLNNDKKENEIGYKCNISLVGSDISKIKINYELFQLYFPSGTADEMIISTYEKLLQRFKNDGFLDSYRSLDIEYRDFKNKRNGDTFINWFQKKWWNYGYNKEFVIWWTLKIFLLVSLLNMFLFTKLQRDVYEINFPFIKAVDLQPNKPITNLTQKGKGKLPGKSLFSTKWLLLKFSNLINSIIYTFIIFFGIKLTLERFKKFNGFTLYIFLTYVLGLFCLSYIFNIIIVK